MIQQRRVGGSLGGGRRVGTQVRQGQGGDEGGRSQGGVEEGRSHGGGLEAGTRGTTVQDGAVGGGDLGCWRNEEELDGRRSPL